MEATEWLKTLRLYAWSRDFFATLDPAVRVVLAKKLQSKVAKPSRHEIVSSSKEEKQWRKSNRREVRIAAKRQRRRWGPSTRTLYLTPGADGSYDPAATATAQFAMLTAEQASGVANHGVYIIGDQVPVRRSSILPQCLTSNANPKLLLHCYMAR
ncbi:MAG: hypothetical protein WDN31_18825 [Hyphomicrobium sp.]